MLAKRLISAAILIPIVIVAVIVGKWAIALLVIVFAGAAAWEFWRLFKTGGYSPSMILMIAGTVGIIAFRSFLDDQFTVGFVGLLSIWWEFPGTPSAFKKAHPLRLLISASRWVEHCIWAFWQVSSYHCAAFLIMDCGGHCWHCSRSVLLIRLPISLAGRSAGIS